jgi:predicted aldo/keto reductase-like oxidoreductase
LHTRRLGRSGLQVSQVGFGGTWISELGAEEAVAVVRRAYELGINYFDTAPLDGDSEEKIGLALQDVRDRCVIATKTASRTKKESLTEVQSSLKRLRTDYIDILQLHGIDDEKTLAKAMGTEGSLQTCKEAQIEGLVRFIGITGHKPRVLKKAIESSEFDTVLVPINILTRQALEELLPAAKAHDVGVVAMKPFSAKTSNLITCLYRPSLSLISDEPELKALLGESKLEMATNALRYLLSQDVSTVIAGVKTISEVETAANAGKNFRRLTTMEKDRFSFELGDYCRDCGACMPCSRGVNIPAALRFHSFYMTYGLKNWARKLYGGLEIKVDKCNRCGNCELKCPYKLSIQNMLEKVYRDLQSST